MPCLFAIMAGVFPRIAAAILWIARPELVSAAFGGSWLWPLLGIIFLPFTTLMWVILWSPISGVAGWDWFWLAISVLFDISHLGGSGYANRDRLPLYQDLNP